MRVGARERAFGLSATGSQELQRLDELLVGLGDGRGRLPVPSGDDDVNVVVTLDADALYPGDVQQRLQATGAVQLIEQRLGDLALLRGGEGVIPGPDRTIRVPGENFSDDGAADFFLRLLVEAGSTLELVGQLSGSLSAQCLDQPPVQ